MSERVGEDERAGEPAAVSRLIEGVQAFRTGVFPRQAARFKDLARHQEPRVLFITCADSRIVPEMITQTQPGELFVCRNIGNIVPSYGEMLGGVSAVIEYAVVALKVSDVVICGHSDCGAMKGLLRCDDPDQPSMPAVANWLRNAETARAVVDATHPGLEGENKVQALVERNVLVQLDHLRSHPAVAARLAEGSLAVHGWVYDIETGGVRIFDPATSTLRAIEEPAETLLAESDAG